MTSSTLILRGYWDAYILEAEEYSRFWLFATRKKTDLSWLVTCVTDQWRIQTFRWVGRGGGQSSRLWHKGGHGLNFFLSALRASFRSKNKGGRGNGPSPGSATADGLYELPEMSFELAFNLVGKLTIAFLTGQSWPDQSRPVVISQECLADSSTGQGWSIWPILSQKEYYTHILQWIVWRHFWINDETIRTIRGNQANVTCWRLVLTILLTIRVRYRTFFRCSLGCEKEL